MPTNNSKIIYASLATLITITLSACGGGAETSSNANKGTSSPADQGETDKTDPVITLKGVSTMNVIKGANYIDAGATANDNHDGNITKNIVIAGDTVNTDTAIGTTFTITYNIKDKAGNSAIQKIRTVSVIESTSLLIPVLSESDKTHYLTLINNARAEARFCEGKENLPAVNFPSMPPLTWSDKLYKSSYEHSQDLAKSNTWSHDGSGTSHDWSGYAQSKKSDMRDRVATYNYIWSRIAENISAGASWDTPEEAIQSWIDSPGHCHNLMSDKVTEVGLALYIDHDPTLRHYWTQNFGKPR